MSERDQLRRALAALAAEDVAELLGEARAGARERARELIEDALVDEIVTAAAAQRKPEPVVDAEGTALWAYGVITAADAHTLPPLEGLEGAAVAVVAERDLAVLVSEVPLADYGDERLREHLNDIAWVERTARAHEAVLDAAVRHCTIVPLRLCTLFRDQAGVRALARDQHQTLQAGLEALDGRAEWGLKLFVDRSRLQPEAATDGAADGAGYLSRKQQERDARAAADDLVSRYAAEAHERLAGVADAARANPVQRPEAHGHGGDMVLNGVYLVRLEREAELMRVVDELRAQWGRDGIDLELTGPWPGYNFAAGAEPVAT